MAKINQDFSMYSGNTKYVYFTVSSLGDVDLEGTVTIEWVMTKGKQVILEKSSADVFTDESNISIISSTVFRVYIRPEDTKDIFGTFSHEAKITVPDLVLLPREVTVATGKIKIIDSAFKEEA